MKNSKRDILWTRWSKKERGYDTNILSLQIALYEFGASRITRYKQIFEEMYDWNSKKHNSPTSPEFLFSFVLIFKYL